MKKILKKIAIASLLVMITLCGLTSNTYAMSSSKNFKTGYKKGDVIRVEYGITGSGRSRWRYVRAKDIYVSEKIVYDKRAKDVTDWNDLSTNTSLSYNKSVSIGASGSSDVIKAMGLKVSVSVSKSTSAGGAHKADPKKGHYARLSIKSDYVEVTYTHITYNAKGKETGRQTKTVLSPISGTQVYYVRYTD